MESIRPPPLRAVQWLMNFFKKMTKYKQIPHTLPRPNKKKERKKKNKTLDIPDYSPEWNPGTASTAQISLLQSHHKHALLLNKRKIIIIIFFETIKQKLVLITFLTIHNYSKLTSIERGKGAIPMGLVSHKCMWVGAGHLSLLQKRILIFNL